MLILLLILLILFAVEDFARVSLCIEVTKCEIIYVFCYPEAL